jgi:hypothetical protein
MSIKRSSSKSSGTGARKPATSPVVRHVDVMAPRQMAAGDTYAGWLCKNKTCGRVIAIVPPQAGGKPAFADSDDQLVVIKCPHCGDENLYRLNNRGEHQYAV